MNGQIGLNEPGCGGKRTALEERLKRAGLRLLLQAILLDPQAPTYYQACAMIDHLCELQKEILPELQWTEEPYDRT